MTEDEFVALLKLSGREMLVLHHEVENGTVYQAVSHPIKLYMKTPGEPTFISYPVEDAPYSREEAVQMLIKVHYDRG